MTCIICTGIPEFSTEPPYEVEVNEHSALELKIDIAGNPRPIAYFRWYHFSNFSQENVSIARLGQFLYHAVYKMNNTDASFCGRKLQATLRNSFGGSSTKDIRVFVLCKFILLFARIRKRFEYLNSVHI